MVKVYTTLACHKHNGNSKVYFFDPNIPTEVDTEDLAHFLEEAKNGTYIINRDDIFIPMDAPKKKGRPRKEVK